MRLPPSGSKQRTSTSHQLRSRRRRPTAAASEPSRQPCADHRGHLDDPFEGGEGEQSVVPRRLDRWSPWRAAGRAHPRNLIVRRSTVDRLRVIKILIVRAAGWPGYPLKRHNDAAHPLYAITMLADFGFSKDDPGIARIAESVLEHFDGDQFETLVWLPRFLTNEDDAEQWDRAARLTPARSQPRFR
jgi:hypothetical protein